MGGAGQKFLLSLWLKLPLAQNNLPPQGHILGWLVLDSHASNSINDTILCPHCKSKGYPSGIIVFLSYPTYLVRAQGMEVLPTRQISSPALLTISTTMSLTTASTSFRVGLLVFLLCHTALSVSTDVIVQNVNQMLSLSCRPICGFPRCWTEAQPSFHVLQGC